MTKKPQWKDLSAGRQAGLIALASVQLALAVAAWADLAARPKEDVTGRKGVWALVIAVNFVGPVAYFAKGRRRG